MVELGYEFHILLQSQFQLVADLFQELKDSAGSPTSLTTTTTKGQKISVRPAKPIPKASNKEHRKTVSYQVRMFLRTLSQIPPRCPFFVVACTFAVPQHSTSSSSVAPVPQFLASADGNPERHDASLRPLHQTQRLQGVLLVSVCLLGSSTKLSSHLKDTLN